MYIQHKERIAHFPRKYTNVRSALGKNHTFPLEERSCMLSIRREPHVSTGITLLYAQQQEKIACFPRKYNPVCPAYGKNHTFSQTVHLCILSIRKKSHVFPGSTIMYVQHTERFARFPWKYNHVCSAYRKNRTFSLEVQSCSAFVAVFKMQCMMLQGFAKFLFKMQL